MLGGAGPAVRDIKLDHARHVVVAIAGVHGLGEGVRIATADIDQNAGFRLRPVVGYGGLQETLTGRCHGGR